MFRIGNIDWKRLRKAMIDSIGIMVVGIILALFAFGPILLCWASSSLWWLILYPIAFFIGNTWEKYNEH